MIFKQFDDRFKFVSQFGFSSPNNKKDWIKVIFPEAASLKRSDTNWDADKLTCTGPVGYNIKILYSVAGFTGDLQKYIVGVQISPIVDTFTFYNFAGDVSKPEKFQHILNLSYQEILPQTYLDATKTETQFFMPKLPKDVFYPLSNLI